MRTIACLVFEWRVVALGSLGVALLCGVPSLFVGHLAAAASVDADPASVKAAFLYRFRGYVEWPGSARTPFTIAVLGDDAVASQLRQFRDERPAVLGDVVIRAVRSAEDARDAHVLYVGRSEAERLRSHAAALAGRPVLVVSDEAEALGVGQTINFVTRDRRIRFEVSLSAADSAGLKVSAGLLNVAARVEGARPGSRLERGGLVRGHRALFARTRVRGVAAA